MTNIQVGREFSVIYLFKKPFFICCGAMKRAVETLSRAVINPVGLATLSPTINSKLGAGFYGWTNGSGSAGLFTLID